MSNDNAPTITELELRLSAILADIEACRLRTAEMVYGDLNMLRIRKTCTRLKNAAHLIGEAHTVLVGKVAQK